MRAHVGDLQQPAGARVRPAGGNRAVDEAQQLELGLATHSSGDRAEKPERCLPRGKLSSTANSFRASDNRALSTSTASSSTRSGEGTRPGFAEANAASAASLASLRIRMTTLTSTPHLRAASACVNCPDVTPKTAPTPPPE